MSARRWLRRLFYLLIVVLWLAVMLFPLLAFRLARNDQIMIGNTRIFLVVEQEQSGIGIQTLQAAGEPAGCQISGVRYLMWRGEAEDQRACTCDDNIVRTPQRRRCVVP